jgi:alpha-glucan,water dikinase
VGRGGEGQRVRDEILQIMHRHHLKEVSGHFLEEWHQKLHNNTTPDDVVICRAYLEFLRRGGDLAAFDRTLEEAGVSRARLESYERPIRSRPEFVPQLKEPLLHDFGVFLGILLSVHSATDYGTALQAARHWLDDPARRLLDWIWGRRDDQEPSQLLEKLVAARRQLVPRLEGRAPGSRDLLYLDLALEELHRAVVERSQPQAASLERLLYWTRLTLESLLLSANDSELALCLAHLQRLSDTGSRDRDWALHVQAVFERLRRAIAAMVDGLYQRVQPKADQLGQDFHAAEWVVRLFGEEVVRGRLEFALSALLRRSEPLLRGGAGLGAWQLVSRGAGEATGRLEVLPSLAEAQGRRFASSCLLVVKVVGGDEEIPEGVSAVLTPATVDLVSHLAVRAREAGVLLATCYQPELLERWQAHRGEWHELKVSASGEVEISAAAASVSSSKGGELKPAVRATAAPRFSRFALEVDQFTPEQVGAKSLHLAGLRGRLPGWIRLPSSVALPFGVFERVLADPANTPIARDYQALCATLEREAEGRFREVLARLRETVGRLAPVPGLEQALREALARSGLPAPDPWPQAWRCLVQVWGSKWNDRAFLSRRARGIADQAVTMAVLVQRVVEADYGFVLHTANPFSNRRDELYAELVPGLGETLVGNHPGRALGASVHKSSQQIHLASFPSKSLGLYGRGLIFRSDSNAEDLAGYAGAGLYDTLTLEPVREQRLDYTREPLVWDEPFRARMLGGLGALGAAVEAALGAPQDVEGTCSRDEYWVVQSRPQAGV